jgi:hypothetical protein
MDAKPQYSLLHYNQDGKLLQFAFATAIEMPLWYFIPPLLFMPHQACDNILLITT